MELVSSINKKREFLVFLPQTDRLSINRNKTELKIDP